MTTKNNADSPYLAENFTKDLASAKTITFENILLRSFVKKIKSYFGVKTAVFAPRTDYWPMIGRMVQNNQTLSEENRVQFPLAFITPTMFEEDDTTFNNAALRRNPMYGTRKEGGSVTISRAHTFLPTIFRFDVTTYTDSFNEFMRISNRWRFGLRNSPDLHMTITFDGIEVDVTVRPDTALAVPKKEQDLNMPNFYEIVMAFEVHGFMSDIEGVDHGAFDMPYLQELTLEYLFGDQNADETPVGQKTVIKND